MKLATIPEAVTDPDSRLRILWVEDSDEMVPQELSPLASRAVFLVHAKSPRDLWSIINREEELGVLRDGYDVYLTDFRLTDRLPEKSTAAQSSPQPLRQRAPNDIPSDMELGITAPSAGFLIGLMVSFRFLSRPSVIIPYSGFPDEFGPVWNLITNFAPPNASIVSPHTVAKGVIAQSDLIRRASTEFRATLGSWIKSGRACLRDAEVTRFLDWSEADIGSEELLTIIHGNFVRQLKLGALFLDSDFATERNVPAQELQAFLRDLPLLDDSQVKSRHLAQSYIDAAESDLSWAMYDCVYSQLDGSTPVDCKRKPDALTWLGGHHSDPAFSREHRRNALLIILIYIHARYIFPFEALKDLEAKDEKGLSVGEARSRLTDDFNLEVFDICHSGLQDLLGKLNIPDHSPLEEVIDELSQISDGPPYGGRVWQERLIQRYVDPAPQSVSEILPDIRPELRIGKGLRRLLDLPEDKPNIEERSTNRFTSILENRACLAPSMLRVARGFANEHLPPNSIWPTWLRGV